MRLGCINDFKPRHELSTALHAFAPSLSFASYRVSPPF